jgi:hypothetical protein
MKLHPFTECTKEAFVWFERGATIYQQFNCEHCGAKQTMDTPNTFFELGTCEECGKETNIKKNGCNYMLHAMLK